MWLGWTPPESVQGGKFVAWDLWSDHGMAIGDTGDTEAAAQNVFFTWLRERPRTHSRMKWCEVENARQAQPGWPTAHMPKAGFWMFFPTTGTTDNPLIETHPDSRMGFHGTSLYCLRRIVEGGTLTTGMASLTKNGEKNVVGVYYHNLEKACLCQQTYMHYTRLDDSGWFFGVLMAISALIVSTDPITRMGRTTAMKRNTNTQYITYENDHEIVGTFIHAVHSSQMCQTESTQYFNCEPTWIPEQELNPRFDFEDILEASFQKAHDPHL